MFESYLIQEQIKSRKLESLLTNDSSVKPNTGKHKKRTKKLTNPRKSTLASSKYRGVYATPSGTYQVQTRVNKILVPLGTFPTKAEAARVFDKYAVDHKLKKRINFPKEHPKHVFKKSKTWSRFTGVTKQSNSFKAQISVNGSLVYIGCYTTEEEAARARDDY
eukprot:CAMPEP_0114332762 /NCGR_PEP_ID=MMETSP0101-20121206/3304_1 /TAXON_ID=38822 ORGANISM="Pteridomonas danica, Strain PT" /NCGR_SAMPLE_ID=MMETSP0101 /ASSEMBLY_ACC=CAM_ASM_000211 /LENGTH=162 /DNA_ID=CAMNT_0001463555 /DNA_START=886 /DNA_END=1371 /DNA_ORIENTATION=-